jgi:secreted Zn-dependent insulinase-like peptidase
LTAKGEDQWQTVIAVLYDHIRLLRDSCRKAKNGDQEELHKLQRIWGEMAHLARIDFDQCSPNQAYSTAPHMAQGVRLYGTAHAISAGSMLQETADTFPLDEVLLEFLETMMDPHQSFMERGSKQAWEEAKIRHENDNADADTTSSSSCMFGLQKEKWYGVDYYLSEIDKNSVLQWKSDGASQLLSLSPAPATHILGPPSPPIFLPGPNEFIPRSLELSGDLPPEALAGPRIDREIDPPALVITNKSEDGNGESVVPTICLCNNHNIDNVSHIMCHFLLFLIRWRSVLLCAACSWSTMASIR